MAGQKKTWPRGAFERPRARHGTDCPSRDPSPFDYGLRITSHTSRQLEEMHPLCVLSLSLSLCTRLYESGKVRFEDRTLLERDEPLICKGSATGWGDGEWDGNSGTCSAVGKLTEYLHNILEVVLPDNSSCMPALTQILANQSEASKSGI